LSCGGGLARQASSAPAPAASRKGQIAPQPRPRPKADAIVGWKEAWRSRRPQTTVSFSYPTSGCVIVAITVVATDTAASATVGAGRRLNASASGSDRKGSTAGQNRGP